MYLELNEIVGFGMVGVALVALAFGVARWYVQIERRRTAELLDSFGITVNTIRRGQ